jgi:hypothetical protein
MILTKQQRRAAVNHLLKTVQPTTLKEIYQLVQQPGWPADYHFGVGIFVRTKLHQKFNWDEETLNSEWAELIAAAADHYIKTRPKVRCYERPDLPARLKSAILATADNLAAIAQSEGIILADQKGEATPELNTMLVYLHRRCKDAELELQPWLGDHLITPQEIAAVLETIAQVLVSEKVAEFAGHTPAWFTDAAMVVERIAQQEPEK